MDPSSPSTAEFGSLFENEDGASRAVWQAFREGRIDEDVATARLLRLAAERRRRPVSRADETQPQPDFERLDD